MKTDAELKQLAVDMYHGHVFTDRHIPKDDPGLLRMVFMVVALGGLNETLQLPEDERPALLYEYIDKALDRSVNGCPIFASVRFLNRVELGRLQPFYEAYKNLQEGFIGSLDEKSST